MQSRLFLIVSRIWIFLASTFQNLTDTPCIQLIIKSFHYSKFPKQLVAASIWWHFEKMRYPMYGSYQSHQQLTYKTLRLFVLLPGVSVQHNWANVFTQWLDLTICNRPECQTGLSLCISWNATDITSHLLWQNTVRPAWSHVINADSCCLPILWKGK